LKEPISTLELQWPKDAAEYSGHVKVEASDDLGVWREVTRAPVVNLQFGGEQLIRRRIECPTVNAKFLRVSWGDAPPKFTLSGIDVETAVNHVDVPRSYLLVKGLAAKEPGTYEFDFGAPLPVDRIDVQLPYANAVVRADILSRPNAGALWRSVAISNFYRLQNSAQEVRSAAVAVPVSGDRYWRVRLLANSTLSDAPGLRAGWVPHRIAFVATGSAPFQLAFGNAAAVSRSVPIGTLIPGWHESTQSSETLSIGTAEITHVHDLGGAAKLTAYQAAWRTWILWIALLIAVGLLTWMAYRLLQDMKRAQ
jgi:hypothetical protein